MKRTSLTLSTIFTTILVAMAFLLVPTAATADGDAGKGIFKKKCKVCHNIKEGGKSGLGPNLFGVIGRKAGSLANFKKYSDGLKASSVKWDEAALSKLLKSPATFVPGSKMKSGKVGDAGQRADIFSYLGTLK